MRGRASASVLVSLVLAVVMALVVSPVALAQAPTARETDDACPPGNTSGADFIDVAPGSVHALSINCAVRWGVALGRSATIYAPGAGVTRAQMASFIARLVRSAQVDLPDGPDAFGDDNGNSHEANINALAATTPPIVQGRGPGQYAPDQVVPRDQMASFLVRAFEYMDGEALPESGDYFTDDATSAHQANINKAAGAGFTGGVGGNSYNPSGPVRREQMASFLMRMLDLVVEQVEGAPEQPPGELIPAQPVKEDTPQPSPEESKNPADEAETDAFDCPEGARCNYTGSMYDWDADGYYDPYVADLNGNGILDQNVVLGHSGVPGDSYVLIWMFDSNEDWVPDSYGGDSNFDAYPDVWLFDANQDGIIEHFQYDPAVHGIIPTVTGTAIEINHGDIRIDPPGMAEAVDGLLIPGARSDSMDICTWLASAGMAGSDWRCVYP